MDSTIFVLYVNNDDEDALIKPYEGPDEFDPDSVDQIESDNRAIRQKRRIKLFRAALKIHFDYNIWG